MQLKENAKGVSVSTYIHNQKLEFNFLILSDILSLYPSFYLSTSLFSHTFFSVILLLYSDIAGTAIRLKTALLNSDLVNRSSIIWYQILGS